MFFCCRHDLSDIFEDLHSSLELYIRYLSSTVYATAPWNKHQPDVLCSVDFEDPNQIDISLLWEYLDDHHSDDLSSEECQVEDTKIELYVLDHLCAHFSGGNKTSRQASGFWEFYQCSIEGGVIVRASWTRVVFLLV